MRLGNDKMRVHEWPLVSAAACLVYISDSVTLMSDAEPVTRSCDEKALAAVNVTGKVALCFFAAGGGGLAAEHSGERCPCRALPGEGEGHDLCAVQQQSIGHRANFLRRRLSLRAGGLLPRLQNLGRLRCRGQVRLIHLLLVLFGWLWLIVGVDLL